MKELKELHLKELQKEKYFGTEYKKTKLSEELIRRFEEALVTPVEGLGLLTEGHSSCGGGKNTKSRLKMTKPEIVEENEHFRVWYLESMPTTPTSRLF
ncbi:hypothetical protein QR680_008236 [Steinernema hermaphroditum]|uniref:Uncharacterized protein n=1 Tax=Steinernema hermaphroditum TaxID=289476 RepID=A0AA39IHZ1_9BILA|nr:hypothetical protein QR680_008236 [Steinernema hermaphroditum]